MIELLVALDERLVWLPADAWTSIAGAWADVCARYGLTQEVDTDPARVFRAGPPPGPAELAACRRTAGELARRLPESVAHVSRFLPATPSTLRRSVTVVLVPHGDVHTSPVDGVQLFSLYPDADALEAYLFLVHVYYHEVSGLFDGPEARRYSREQRTADDFRRWIRLLIRNEGIGNHAVMADVVRFAGEHPGSELRYFTYAPLVMREGPLEQAVEVLRQVFDSVTDDNVRRYRMRVASLFKNKQLPIINLVGTHMAGLIAERLGLSALKDVYQVEADRFFDLYGEAGGPHAEALGVAAAPVSRRDT
jgi:hypothetical protein